MKKDSWLVSFFINFGWLGIILVLIATVIEKSITDLNIYQDITVLMLNTLGISILVAFIFTYVSGTSKFLGKITSLLKDIIIDRSFLENIDSEGKKNALAALIKPSEAERQVYSDIGRYYDMYINHTLNISEKCVRSDYSVNAVASKNNELSKVQVLQRINYRLHPTVEGYSDITIGVDEGDLGSEIKKVTVSTPDNKTIYDESNPESQDITNIGNLNKRVTISLKEKGEGHSYLKVYIEITEVGHDHWTLLSFQALQPTDGFRYFLECRDGLKVTAQNAFINGAEFRVEAPDSETSITYCCDKWINEGTGLAIVISDPKSDTNDL